MARLVAALVVALFAGAGNASAASDPAPAAPANQFLVRPVFGFYQASLQLSPQSAPTEQGKTHAIEWAPNSSLKTGARVGWGPFLATITFSTGSLEPEDTHGKSRGVELQFTGTIKVDEREIAGTVFYQRYSGYYLDNTETLFAQAEAPLLAPRMALSTYGANLLFFFSPRFSYDDAFVEFRPRARSGFSPGLRLAMGNFAFDAGPNALIPGKYREDYGEAFGLTAVDATYASVGGGIGADWRPWGRVLLGFSGFLGATFSAARYRAWGYERRTPTAGLSITTQIVAGYAGDLLHGGMMVAVDSDGMHIEGTDVNSLRSSVLLFVGIRL